MRVHGREVPTSHYRMSSDHTIEAAQQRLADEPHQSPIRILGYANRHILRVDYRPSALGTRHFAPEFKSAAGQPAVSRQRPCQVSSNRRSSTWRFRGGQSMSRS